MTAAGPETTLKDLFRLPDDEQFSALLMEELKDERGLEKLDSDAQKTISEAKEADWSGLQTEVARLASDLLNIDVISILAGAWNHALTKYVDVHKGPPGHSQIVSLSDHPFSYDFSPLIELLVLGEVAKTLQLDVAVDFVVKGVELEIQNGRITSIAAGWLEGSGSIHRGKKLVWHRAFEALHLPGKVHLGKGIPITPRRHASKEGSGKIETRAPSSG